MLKSLDGLVEPKILAILKTLINNPNKLYHLLSLSKSSKVPLTSTHRIISKLKKQSFVEEQKIGKISVYKIANNQKVNKIKLLI
jgi:uncharacterized membrane protein